MRILQNEKILHLWFVGGVFLLLPLIILPHTYDVVLPVRHLFLVVWMLFGGLLLFKKRQKSIHSVPNSLFYPFLALLGMILLSGISAANFLNTGIQFIHWACLLGMLFLGSWYIVHHDSRLQKISTIVSIYLIISSVAGILQYYGIALDTIPPTGKKPYFTMGNVNLYASSLFVSLPFAAINLIQKSKGRQWVSVLGILGGLWAIFLADSQAVFLGLGVMGLILAVILPDFLRNETVPKARQFLLTWKFRLIVLAILMVGGTFWGFQSGKFDHFGHLVVRAWDKGGKGISPRSNSTEERIILWKHSLEMAADNPLTGVGAGNWRYEIGKYGVKGYYLGYGTRFYVRPHNEFLGVLAELGVPGLLAFLALIGFALRNFFVAFSRSKTVQNRRIAMLFCAFFIGFWAISSFSFPLERVYHSVMFTMMLAVSGVLYLRTNPKKRPGKPWFAWVFLAISAISLVGIYPAVSRVRSDAHFLRLTEAQLGQNWTAMLKQARQAETPFYLIEPMAATPVAWYNGVAQFYQNRFPEALEAFQRAYEVHPNHVQVMQNLGSAFIKTNQIDKGVEMYERTLELYPDFDECRRNLSQVYYATQDYKKLRRTISYWAGKQPGMGLNVYYREMTKKLDSLQYSGYDTIEFDKK